MRTRRPFWQKAPLYKGRLKQDLIFRFLDWVYQKSEFEGLFKEWKEKGIIPQRIADGLARLIMRQRSGNGSFSREQMKEIARQLRAGCANGYFERRLAGDWNTITYQSGVKA